MGNLGIHHEPELVSETYWIVNWKKIRTVGVDRVRRCREKCWVSRATGTAWRHPIGNQALYQRCVVFWFTKNAVFIFSQNRNRLAL